VYDLKSFELLKLLNASDSNITALEWQPVHEKYLAQGTFTKQFAIWDLETEKIKF
jgi:WD40 repeat protein